MTYQRPFLRLYEIDCLHVAEISASGESRLLKVKKNNRGLTWLLTAFSSLGEWEGVEKRIN